MKSAEIHSVILNLNKNFSNNTGANFKQIVNKQLELKPNTLVALYSGNIVRKPIVIEEPMVLDIELASQFPTLDLTLTPDNNTDIKFIADALPTKIQTVVAEGYYSKISFARYLCATTNDILETSAYSSITSTIVPISGGNVMQCKYNYRLYFEVKDDNVFLGLRRVEDEGGSGTPTIDETGNFRVEIENLDDGQNNTTNITIAANAERLIFQSSARTNNWDSYALGNQPIMPQCYSHLSDPETSPLDVGWANVNINIDPIAASNEVLEFCYVFNNTYFTSKWNPGGPPTEKQLVDVNEKPSVVSGLLGAYLQVGITAGAVTSKRLTFYVNENIYMVDKTIYDSTVANIDVIMDANMRSLMTVDLDKYDFTDVLSGIWCEVYAIDKPQVSRTKQQNDIFEDSYEYYFRWYIRSPYSNFNELTLLFDSKNVGLRLPNLAVDTAYLFQALQEDKNAASAVCGGLCPQFYFKNCFTDLKVSQPTINSNITFNSVDEVFQYLVGIKGYGFKPTGTHNSIRASKNTQSLQNVLGVSENETEDSTTIVNPQTIFCPSKFPSNKSMAGLTQLNSDDLRYNIELNLPIKAYNTTEQTTNDIGQTRTILYNTNATLNKDDSPSIGLVNKELLPSNLKYLSLNNPEPIKLNTIDVNIRRAKTNEIAEEITDASIELLFYSEGNPSGRPPNPMGY